ncbi:MAG: hypothetical protein AAGF85_20575 [Bacteroidota bacterium]
MIVLDIIFFGWYQILDKTIYASKTVDDGIGPKEHSFFITFLLHGINIYTVLRYVFIEYYGKPVELSISLPIAATVFVLGYFIYYKKKRVDKVIAYKMSALQVILSLILTLVYTVATVYFMLEIGNYVRGILHPELI